MQVAHVERRRCVFIGNKGREVTGIVELLGRIDSVFPCRADNP